MNQRSLVILALVAVALFAALYHSQSRNYTQQEQDCRSRGGQPLFNERSQPSVICLRKEALQ